MKKNTQKPGKQRLQIHEITHENDMRYRGPLNYQHFQMLGWLCIVVSQAVVLLKLGARFDGQFATDTAGALNILRQIAHFSLPFLLIANFAQILDASDGYMKQLVKNIYAVAAVCGLFYLFFFRYLVGGLELLLVNPADALPTVLSALKLVAKYGFLDFNIFVDLLLCTLVMLFLNYRPKHIFTGKFVIVFRLFALLPIAYEVCCMVLKIRAAQGFITVPVWVYPLLTVKPPMTFVLFVAMAVFVKTRERRFRRHGKTHEEYQAFLKTRRNSWNFSVFLAIMMVVVSVIDFGVVVGFSVNEGVQTYMTRYEAAADKPEGESPAQPAAEEIAPESPAQTAAAEIAPESPEAGQTALPTPDPDAALNEYLESDEMYAAFEKGVLISKAVGFGESMHLAFLAPLILLFSYTRKPKNGTIGLLIPAVGILLILALYIEGSHQLLITAPIRKLDLQEIKTYFVLLSSMLE